MWKKLELAQINSTTCKDHKCNFDLIREMHEHSLWYGRQATTHTTRKVAICDDLLMTLLTFVTEWYVFYDEISIFVIVGM
jgi:hypothetical protein